MCQLFSWRYITTNACAYSDTDGTIYLSITYPSHVSKGCRLTYSATNHLVSSSSDKLEQVCLTILERGGRQTEPFEGQLFMSFSVGVQQTPVIHMRMLILLDENVQH